MALATIDLSFDDDLLKQIDYFADNESLTRADLIYNSVKMYINRKKRLQELYTYGESIVRKNNLTEDDVMEEIKNYRKTK
jgi:metal-responsive CopG/Arc/MetJ family transcriptional regulator